MYSESLVANSGKKIFMKSLYLEEIVIEASLAKSKANQVLQDRWMCMSELRDAIWNRKIFLLGLRVAATNFFLSTSLICLVMNKALAMVKNPQLSF